MEEAGVDRATLVTLLDQGEWELPRGTVRVVPAWRWILEGADEVR
jgi:hypothetical protein